MGEAKVKLSATAKLIEKFPAYACNRSPDIDAGIEEPDACHIIPDTDVKNR